MDYLNFFELKEDPFGLTPDSDFFYPAKIHSDVLASLDYAVDQKEGFSLVVGEPGTGKTTLVKILMSRWRDSADIALIMTPRLSSEELLHAVLDDLNVKAPNTNKNSLIVAFRDFLVDRSHAGKRVIIIVDEAQNLSDVALEELRLLSNLETEKEKLLQIILIGQPELLNRLHADNMRQLNQRISVRATLLPLTPDEISDYISFRLIKAGKGSPIFGNKVKRIIGKLSGGVPRMINLITSRAMMAAYIASSHNILKRHVRSAVEHLAVGSPKKTRPSRWSVYASSLVMIASLALPAFIIYQTLHHNENPPVGSPNRSNLTKTPSPAMETPPPLSHPPVPSAALEKPRPMAKITSDTARLREGPSLQAKVAGTILPQESLTILDEWTERSGNKWYYVKTLTGQEGWVASYIIKIGSSH